MSVRRTVVGFWIVCLATVLARTGSAQPHDPKSVAQQRNRLSQWRNLFGDLTKCLETAEKEPVFYEMLRLELSLEPVSANARRTREITSELKPAAFAYMEKVNLLIAAIGSGTPSQTGAGAGQFVRLGQLRPDRARRVRALARALLCWLAGRSLDEARGGRVSPR